MKGLFLAGFLSLSAQATAHGRAHSHSVPHARSTKSRRSLWAVPQTSLKTHALTFYHARFQPRWTEWDGETSSLPIKIKSPPAWSAVLVDGLQLVQGCAKGWFRPLDKDAECGQSGGSMDFVLAWDRSRLPMQPDWNVLWNVARYPGRRGLYLGARTTLEIALLADGVPPKEIYRQLSTPAGVERAFHMLDILRPYIVWWRSPSEAAQIMKQRAALVSSAPSSAVALMRDKSHDSVFVMSERAKMLQIPLFWAVPSALADGEACQTIDHLRQLSPHFTDVPASSAQNVLIVDDNFWLTHGEALEKRFQKWFGSTAR